MLPEAPAGFKSTVLNRRAGLARPAAFRDEGGRFWKLDNAEAFASLNAWADGYGLVWAKILSVLMAQFDVYSIANGRGMLFAERSTRELVKPPGMIDDPRARIVGALDVLFARV